MMCYYLNVQFQGQRVNLELTQNLSMVKISYSSILNEWCDESIWTETPQWFIITLNLPPQTADFYIKLSTGESHDIRHGIQKLSQNSNI
jgi:hypothetical protein